MGTNGKGKVRSTEYRYTVKKNVGTSTLSVRREQQQIRLAAEKLDDGQPAVPRAGPRSPKQAGCSAGCPGRAEALQPRKTLERLQRAAFSCLNTDIDDQSFILKRSSWSTFYCKIG